MRLKAGADPRKAQTDVARLWMELGSIYGGQAEQARRYVKWVQGAETTLRNHFEGIDLDRLYTHRFWRISVGDIDQLSQMITHEVTVQRAWLDQLKLELDEGIKRFGNLDAAIVVPDTNALLHYRLFDEIDWPCLAGRAPVALVVPLAVIDELDRKKASRNPHLAKRAATVIRHLRATNGRTVRDGVTVTVVGSMELGVGRRPAATLEVDLEILDTCESLAAYTTAGVVKLASGDYGMELRATGRRVDVLTVPDELRSFLGAQET